MIANKERLPARKKKWKEDLLLWNNYKKISTLSNNTIIEIVSVVGKWYKITSGSVTGYVYSTFVTVTESKEVDDSAIPHRGKVKNGRNIAKSASRATLSATKWLALF